MTPETPGAGSTVRRILLGSQLRRLRESKGVSRQQAGYVIRASESKISRLELGRVSFKERDVADLLTLYDVTDEAEREALLQLARDAKTPGWWQRYNEVLPKWFHAYVGLEEAAALIRTYECQFVPGLLQSEDYARSVIRQGNAAATEDEIADRVTVRMQRAQRLTAPGAPRLWAVLDEAALKREIGGPDVMRGQFEHLIAMSKLPNVTIQVMPFRFGGHAAEGGAFSILRFPEPDLPDVVYVENLVGALYLDKRDDVDSYLQAMERLCVDSETPERTVETLDELLRKT
ncbi:helix-turn-helix domain-containing protein [Thermomonospora umbrina]|uniref:Xre family transcriptional regulator n=1 Tax=Thermomonospora umbrina TaxID=111806 RepID=A0A3D9SPA8_9ACTN|nr:helix-turn-helix transcriptional regulator [Thermomonospora umbrina]REE96280.1 Xre family transcriptional regulator [Thermomonospora umbrina]